MPATILSAGIDTLKVNVKFTGEDGKPMKTHVLPSHLDELFAFWQTQAQAEWTPVPTRLTFNEARLMMLPNGAPMWKYLIKNNWIQLACGPRMNNSGVGKVTFASEYLWAKGSVGEALDEVHGFLIDVFGENLYLQASQIDVCVDIVGLHLPTIWQKVFIARARGKTPFRESDKEREYYRGRELETLNFSGHGNPLSCRIYNKSLEIRQRSPHKRWFHDLWQANGWDGTTEVWRVEFSLERACLRDMKLDEVYEVIRNSKRLWTYCTHDWLRMVVPSHTIKNRRRWKTNPAWVQLQHAFEHEGCRLLDQFDPLVRKRKREANIEQGIAQVAGNITTLAAWLKDELDEDADAQAIFNMAYDKVVERWAKQGVDAQTLVREKKFLYHQSP